jgi:hypothetical protein
MTQRSAFKGLFADIGARTSACIRFLPKSFCFGASVALDDRKGVAETRQRQLDIQILAGQWLSRHTQD